MITAADGDAVRDLTGRARARIKSIGDGPDLGPLQLRQLLQAGLNVGGRQIRGKLAKGDEFDI